MAEKIPNRQAICDTLRAHAARDRGIVVLCSDSRGSASMTPFAQEFPKQFVEVGIAEQNLVSIGAGLASCGKKVFAAYPACFLSTRSYEQVKVDCAYSDTNVTLIGISGGVSYGALGMSHHSLQDIAAMSAIPNMRVYLPNEMTARFWRACTAGAYCTHGETFLDDENEILWWSKGGTLKGESAPRIAFLRQIIESLPGHLEGDDSMYERIMVPPEEREAFLEKTGRMGHFAKIFWRLEDGMRDFADSEMTYRGHIGDDCFLEYYDRRTCGRDTLRLPENRTYRVELIDTWNMTREVLLESASGNTVIQLPGREHMAVLVTANPA